MNNLLYSSESQFLYLNKREWRRDKLGVWDYHIHTTIYKIDNQLCSTGNSTQYFVITYKGKESEKEYIHIYVYHFAVHLKLAQHCKSIILQ